MFHFSSTVMLNSKLFVLILYFSQILAFRQQKKSFEPYSRFKSVKCSASLISLSSFDCFVKAYSQRNTTINAVANVTKPIFVVNIRYDLRFKSLSNSQRSIINATTEICSILNGIASNPVYQWILGMMPEFKQSLHPCPYQVLSCGCLQTLINP
ncbi:hypothetical protein ACKWTF_014341 [Chironomus riparius]